jgi:hypothetical protein
VGVVGDRGEALGLVVLGADGAGLAGLVGLALEEDGGALLLGLALLLGVGLDADDELLAGAGEADVLDAEVDALLDVAVADLLVDDDTDSGLGHVVDDTSLAVVVLVAGRVLVSVGGARGLATFFCEGSGGRRLTACPSGRHRCRRHRQCHQPCTDEGRWTERSCPSS